MNSGSGDAEGILEFRSEIIADNKGQDGSLGVLQPPRNHLLDVS